ncbi:MAG: hypothetical protein LC117_08460 [Bacteroidia bacterium]|nr:hypothetical protein [Bacteroidia bacterium]MCZ2277943.1 hypothetical protein [Bacteroidia bacterium]
MISFGLWITYLLLIVAVATVIIFPLRNLLKDPKAAKGTLIGLGILVGLFLVSFLISGGQANEKYQISDGESKMIGAGLVMCYVLGIGAILVGIFVEIKKALSK